MKKVYPLGNKIEELLNKTRDNYIEKLLKEVAGVDEPDDVPDVNWDSEYHTEVPLSGLPPGGYGYPTKDSAYDEEKVNILVGKDNYIKPDLTIDIPKKKKKFISDVPPKENFHEKPEIKFEDVDYDEDVDFERVNVEDIDLLEQEDPKKKTAPKKQKVPANVDPNTGKPYDMDVVNTAGADEMPPDPSTAAGQTHDMSGIDPSAAGGMYQDPTMGGGMGAEPPKSAEEIGRIFELKKIYARLISVEEYLSFSPDEILITLRDYTSKCIELFETLISNIDSFKDQVDDIIVVFYKFLERVYSIINQYYKIKNKEEGGQENKTSLFTKPAVVYSKKGSPGPEKDANSNSTNAAAQNYNTLK